MFDDLFFKIVFDTDENCYVLFQGTVFSTLKYVSSGSKLECLNLLSKIIEEFKKDEI